VTAIRACAPRGQEFCLIEDRINPRIAPIAVGAHSLDRGAEIATHVNILARCTAAPAVSILVVRNAMASARSPQRRRSVPCSRAWLSLLPAVIVTACAAENNDPRMPAPMQSSAVCLAGQQVACACSGNAQGVQVCDATGAFFGACSCPAASIPLPSGGAGGAAQAGAQAAGAGAGAGGAPLSGSGGTMVPPMPMAEAPLASGVRITEIAIYQAVKISLASVGEPVVARNAPVIVGKDAFLRVFVEPLPGSTGRDIEVELNLVSSEGPAAPQTVTQRISAASSDAMLESTINFDIPGDQMTRDLRYSVALHEVGGAVPAGGMADPAARFPKELGTQIALEPRDAGPLRVMLVPYRYTADGSNRLPAMDQEQLDLFQRVLHSYYPASDIQMEVHPPVDYSAAIGPMTGWEQWLEFHCALRTEEDPDPKLLYYGIVAPRESARAYGGGVVGISNLPSAAANYGRCSVGVGFSGGIAASTMAHELGHSLGLPHAPCGVNGGPFPYEEARIGVWGYSLGTQMLKDPNENYDLMSYCNPVFISDFNFEKIFERIRYLNLQFDVTAPAQPVRYLRLLQDGRGRVSVRGRLASRRVPGGPDEERPVNLRDARGRVLGAPGPAYYFPFSEGGAGVWLVPDVGAAAVEIDALGRVPLR